MARLPREDSRTAIPQLEKNIDALVNRVDALLDFFYPVGTVYETLDGKFNPNKAWGGEWERIKGKTLVGVDEDDVDFVDGASGGSKGAWKHTHNVGYKKTTSNYLPQNSTALRSFRNGGTVYTPSINGIVTDIAPDEYSTDTFNQQVGSDNNTLPVDKANMPPYITVYMWRRTK